MGFSFRRSSSLGPFRLNFSKSGISASVGVKDARVTLSPKGRTYITIGAGGFSYRQNLSSETRTSAPGPHVQMVPEVASLDEIKTADVEELRESSKSELSANDAGIDHDIPVLPALQQIGEDTIPDASRCPSRKTLVSRLVLAIALGHVLPAHARTQDPQHAVNEPPVIFRRTTHRSSPPRQQQLDPTPLYLRQLITTNAHPPTAPNPQQYEK